MRVLKLEKTSYKQQIKNEVEEINTLYMSNSLESSFHEEHPPPLRDKWTRTKFSATTLN